MNTGVVDRLSALAEREHPALRALWIDTLPPQEALAELFGRQDDLSLLQKARFLLDLGRGGDAAEVLRELGDLPAGLAGLRQELVDALEGAETEPAGEEPPDLASPTLAELHASQGDQEAAIAMYREVLGRDPSDAQARRRLRQLTGPWPIGSAEVLGDWLERVRRWRSQHGA